MMMNMQHKKYNTEGPGSVMPVEGRGLSPARRATSTSFPYQLSDAVLSAKSKTSRLNWGTDQEIFGTEVRESGERPRLCGAALSATRKCQVTGRLLPCPRGSPWPRAGGGRRAEHQQRPWKEEGGGAQCTEVTSLRLQTQCNLFRVVGTHHLPSS